jgi:ABC-2 type transport system permease protein
LNKSDNSSISADNLGYTKLLKENIGLTINLVYYTHEKETKDFPNSVQQNVPGWTIFALFWIVQIITLNIMIERQSGAFKRMLVSPISSFHYIVGKSIPYFIINIIQAVFMFSIGVFILPLFGCPPLVIKNILGMLLITFGISLTAISLSFFLSSISKTVSLTASLSGAILILMTVFGGIMVPKFIMPKFMQNISMFVPHGWALDGYQKILVKDYTLIQILPNFGVLVLFSLFFSFISLFYFSKLIRKQK